MATLILSKFANCMVKTKKINISCILVCNFFSAKHYQSRCWSKWDNLHCFQYRVVPDLLRHSHTMNKRHYSAKLQPAKQTPTTSKILIEVTYGDFPCHLKANRDKLALLNCLWKCKKSQRLRITTNSFMKIDQSDGFRPLRWSRWENSSRSRNQSDCRICCPLTSWKR